MTIRNSANPAWPKPSRDEMSRATAPRLSEIYAEAAQTCPVRHLQFEDGSTAWAVLRQAELEQALADTETLSSQYHHFGDKLWIPIELDPPEHGPFRQMLNGIVNRQFAEQREPMIREYVRRTVSDYVAAGGGDIVAPTARISMHVLCSMLGLPDEEWQTIKGTQEQIRKNPMYLNSPEAKQASFEALNPVKEYARKLVSLRLTQPADDIVSRILAANIAGRRVTEEEACNMTVLLLIAGHHTTGNGMAGASWLMATNPNAQDKLRQNPQSIPVALEECLRLEPPVHALNRVVAKSTTIGETALEAGDHVMVSFGGANLDEAAFPGAGELNIERRPNRHFSFGRGIHMCLGAPIARLEMKVYLEELLRQTKTIKPAGEIRRGAWPDLKFKHIPLTVEAA